MKITKSVFLCLLCLIAATSVFAQSGGKAEPNRIKFAKGKSKAVLTGTLSNGQEMDYAFGASAGQTVTLKITSEPKGKLFEFDLAGDGFDLETEYDTYADYTFTAPQTGDYLIFVKKRPTEKVKRAKFFLTLSIK